jgi:hypothetical protein
MDAFEWCQESMAQHLAATVEAISRIGGYKPPSKAEEEDDSEQLWVAGKGILRPVMVGGRGAPPGGTFLPGSSSSARPPDVGRGPETHYLDLACHLPRHGPPPAQEQHPDGDHGRATDHSSGKVPMKMNFPTFNGEFPHIWRDKCLDYFRVCNIHATMWLTAATLHLEGDAAHWFQSYKLKHVVQGWPDFITAVEAKFGVHDYREFMDELLALKQGGTILNIAASFRRSFIRSPVTIQTMTRRSLSPNF